MIEADHCALFYMQVHDSENYYLRGAIMGYDSYIEIDCRRYSDRIADMIEAFKTIGWDIHNYDGAIEYLPIGDIYDFDWQVSKLSESELKTMIDYKQDQDELVGLHLFFTCEEAGISVSAKSTNEIMIGLDIYRKTCKDNTTDLAWYFNNIIVPLRANGCIIDHITIRESTD